MTLLTVVSICILGLIIEGFFSGSEIALVSSDQLALEKAAKSGHKGAKLALKLLDNSGVMLAVTLIGTNLAVVTNTIVMTLFFLEKFGPRGEIYSVLIMSPLVLLFGEIVPKAVFQQHANSIAIHVSYVIYYSKYLFYPLVLLMRLFSASATSLLGIQQNKVQALSREDLKFLIQEENELFDKDVPRININSISIKEGEREIIGNILTLRDTTVEEVMIPLSEVVSAPQSSTLSDLADLVTKYGYTRIPIYKDRVDVVVGIVHGFDVLATANPDNKASSIMQPPIFVPETQHAYKLLIDLQQARKGMAIVVNEYGGAEGIVTIEDVLEEIVGEIEDEFDKPEDIIVNIDEMTWVLSGRISISHLNEELELELKEDEPYETVAGLILHHTRRLPSISEEIYFENFKFTILEMTDRAIIKIKLEKIDIS
ncbi:MAG: HlyC/CorC family transporter [Deltaproteobacteria bacterium]|nr:HlyC/CorC family transporter [Deltaproteobacteria bacterium]